MTEADRAETSPDAPPILSNVPGSFAWGVVHQRHPALVQQIRDAFPYPPDRDHALDRLGQESSTGLITPLSRSAPDRQMWDSWSRDYLGQRWIEVPFLWAESYFYRKLLDVIGFFEPGPWAGIDPFVLWSILSDQPGRICVVADNAGPELLADLVLIDHLLSSGCAASVTLHLKPYPYYVSDATTADLIACLRRLRHAPPQVAEVGHRLWQALRTGRLIVGTHTFSCAPWSYHRMPADLAEQFSAAALTIMKGDLSYRRLVGDRHWPATTPFGSLTRYFPGPVAALRTLKSDVVTGLDQQTLATLDSTGEQWRTNGTHALIQVRP